MIFLPVALAPGTVDHMRVELAGTRVVESAIEPFIELIVKFWTIHGVLDWCNTGGGKRLRSIIAMELLL